MLCFVCMKTHVQCFCTFPLKVFLLMCLPFKFLNFLRLLYCSQVFLLWPFLGDIHSWSRYPNRKKQNKTKQELCVLCSIFSHVSLAEKEKMHVTPESLAAPKRRMRRRRKKAVYVRKNKREKGKKGTPRRATCHKWFLNNEIHTTVHFTIRHPGLLTLQVQACKSQII